MKQLLVAVVFGVLSFSALALTEYQLASSVDGTVVDWTNDASYTGGKAPTDLSSACIVIDGLIAKVDSSTFTDFAKVAEIKFQNGDNSKCIVDTGVGDFSTPGAFNGEGWLVKKGSGKLTLTSVGRIVKTSGEEDRDRFCHIDIQEGTLDDSVVRDTGIKRTQFQKLTVAKGATLVISKNHETWVTSAMNGAGTITAPAGSDVGSTRIMPRYQGSQAQEFSGVIDDLVRIYTSASLYLSGTNSTSTGTTIIDGGKSMPEGKFLQLESFGLIGKPSSIGSDSGIVLQEYGGRIQYAGTRPETSDKEFLLCHSYATEESIQSMIDGGPYGALTLTGLIHPGSYRINQRLWIGGSNANACVISGKISNYIYDNKKSDPDRVVTTNRIHLTKTGTGTWRLAHNDSRDGLSGVTVKNGVLSFDTLGEIGEKCSFGTGRMPDGSVAFYPDLCESLNPAHVIPYQFILGDAASKTVGTLALAAPTGCVAVTRPIGIAGCGAISNGFAKSRMALAGVSPLAGSTSKTLILEGESTADNVVYDVTNDVSGTLSVVKRGTGKWILSGNQTFGGALKVEGGELVVRETKANEPFSWFRLVLKENWGEYKNGALCDFWAKSVFLLGAGGFALYDASGNNLAKKCTTMAEDYAGLNEKEAAYANILRKDLDYINTATKKHTGTNFCAMVNEKDRWVGGLTRPYRSDPDTWVTVDLRLPAGLQVAAVDFASQYGYDHNQITTWDDRGKTKSNWWNYSANIKYFNMYGSTDGAHWEPLFDDDVYMEGTNYNTYAWFFGAGYSEGVAKGLKFDHAVSSRPAATVLPTVGTVSVANGGVLRVEGNPVTIRSLAVDPSGAGTISNVMFAANGTLVVPETLEGNDVALPGTYLDVSGFDEIAANWTLDAGKKSRSYRIANKNGTLHLVKKGLMLIIR